MIGSWIIFQTGSMHFHPNVITCTEDYEHIPISFIKMHHSHRYSLFYFQPFTQTEEIIDHSAWFQNRIDIPPNYNEISIEDEYDIDLETPTFPGSISEVITPKNENIHTKTKKKQINPPIQLFSGTPILFIPGHAGEYKQGKGLASTIYKMQENYNITSIFSTYNDYYDIDNYNDKIFDFFGVDFDWDFSVFHGSTLEKQAKYVTKSIEMILNFYRHLPIIERPKSVILVGHSMGGVVARLAVKNLGMEIKAKSLHSPQLNLVESKYIEQVDTIITLGTPHVTSPWPIDETTSKLYQSLNTFYFDHKNDYLRNLVILSISGGIADTQVQSELSELPMELISSSKSLFVQSTSIPSVRQSIAHQALCRCKSLLETISKSIYDIEIQKTTKPKHKISIFKKYFNDPIPNHLELCKSHSVILNNNNSNNNLLENTKNLNQIDSNQLSELFDQFTSSDSLFYSNTLANRWNSPIDWFNSLKVVENLNNHLSSQNNILLDKNSLEFNEIQFRLQYCTLISTKQWKIINNNDDQIPYDLCWQIDKNPKQKFFLLSSFDKLPSNFIRLINLQSNEIFQVEPELMKIHSNHFNGSFIQIQEQDLIGYNFIYINTSKIIWPNQIKYQQNIFSSSNNDDFIFTKGSLLYNNNNNNEQRSPTQKQQQHFLFANWISDNNHFVLNPSKSSIEVSNSPFLHFQFPWLTNKHKKVDIKVSIIESNYDNNNITKTEIEEDFLLHNKQQQQQSSSNFLLQNEKEEIFTPFFIQITQTPNTCESMFTQSSKIEKKQIKYNQETKISKIIYHTLEFHQSEPFISAPNLFLISDPTSKIKIEFEYGINYVQCFRSYSRFLLPVMLALPFITLAFMIHIWIRNGIYFGYYFGMSNLVVKYLSLVWLFFLFFDFYFFKEVDSPLDLFPSNVIFSDRSDLIALFDDDLILHSRIPIPNGFLLIAPICAIGWVVAWSSPMWLLVIVSRFVNHIMIYFYLFLLIFSFLLKRKLYIFLCFKIHSFYEGFFSEENSILRVWPVVASCVGFLCFYQPLIALVISSALLFVRIITNKSPVCFYLFIYFYLLILQF